MVNLPEVLAGLHYLHCLPQAVLVITYSTTVLGPNAVGTALCCVPDAPVTGWQLCCLDQPAQRFKQVMRVSDGLLTKQTA